jgi:hypothetical protein
MSDPTYDGGFVLGTACHVVHRPLPNGEQIDAVPGISGVFRTDLGGRGRMFEVSGLFVGPDIPTVTAQEALLLSYADGVTRTLVDTYGRAWSQVVFTGDYHPDPHGITRLAGGGWCLHYRATFRGLG